MRILLLGTAAIALSGCSWLGMGHGNYHHAPAGDHGYYPGPQVDTSEDCCDSYSKWNLEGAIGQEYMVGGDFTTPGDLVAPIGGGTTLNKVSMKDAYDEATRYDLGISKALNPNRKFTLMGSYSKAEGQDVALLDDGVNTLSGTASDYKQYGIEAGLRQYFSPTPAPVFKALRPYVEGRIGASKVDDINVGQFRINGGAAAAGTVAAYEGGWVPTASGLVGVEAPVFKQATLGLETGIRYRGSLDGDNTDLGGSVLEGANNGSESWSVPVMLRGRYRF